MMHGGEGIILDKKVSWPFERSGTITMWYNMREETKECKLFELVNSEKAGF